MVCWGNYSIVSHHSLVASMVERNEMQLATYAGGILCVDLFRAMEAYE